MAAPPLDLRTYLLLERAFVRRLQRSWRQQSAPVYDAIAQHCRDRQWDKARQRVPDLDMTEVGTENREWITFMLLSFAVFGAGTVSRKKPSFVGVGTFDTFLKQVTNNFLQYLELNATAQIQAEALQSIAEDEAKTKAVKFDPRQPRDKEGQWTRTGAVASTPEPLKQPDKPYRMVFHDKEMREKSLADHAEFVPKYKAYVDARNMMAIITKDLHAQGVPESNVEEYLKHPAYKQAYDEFLAAAREVGPYEEKRGPARERWEDQNQHVMNVTDSYIDAKESHRDLIEMLKAEEENEGKTEGAWLHSEEYLQSKAKMDKAQKTMSQQEHKLKQYAHEMQVEMVRRQATIAAIDMGVDPSLIDVVAETPREFVVGNQHMTEAAHFNPTTGRIQLNAENISYANAAQVKGITAHEISHLIYQTIEDEKEKEFQAYLHKATTLDGRDYTDWYRERFTGSGASRQLKPQYREEFQRLYPATMAMSQIGDGEPFTGIGDRMIAEDGHSEYSKSYWTPQAVDQHGRNYRSATNETIAELTRYLTNPSSWHEAKTPHPASPWMQTTQAMLEWYAKHHGA